jgi:hypothetical protein
MGRADGPVGSQHFRVHIFLGIPVNKEADYLFRADQATHLAIFEPLRQPAQR